MPNNDLRQLPDNTIVLAGNHTECDPLTGASGCVMNLTAWVCGYTEITDTPECASPILTRYAIKLNDSIRDDALRTELMLPLVYKLAGSKSTPDVEQKRLFFLIDKATRVFAPIALRACGLEEHAAKLEALPLYSLETAAQHRAADSAAVAAAYAARAGAAAYAAGAAAGAAAAAAYTAGADAAAAAYDAAYNAARAGAAAAYAAAIYRQAAQFLMEACDL